MHSKQMQTIAKNLLSSLSRAQIAVIAEHGYAGALPAGLTEDEREDLRQVINDTATCVNAGAYSLA
jgi:hypothetical protein